MSKMTWATLCFVIFLGCAAPTATAATKAPERCREGNLLFDMPEGWQRKKTDNGVATLAPAQTPPGKWVEIRMTPAVQNKSALRDLAGGEIASIRQNFTGVQASNVTLVRHRFGFDVAFVSVSMNSGRSPNEFLYTTVYLAGIGDTVQRIVFIANDAALFNQNRATANNFVQAVNFTNLEVIDAGPPALTQATVDEVIDFLEWLLEVPFTQDQRGTVRTFMVDSWRKKDRVEMTGVADILNARKPLAALAPERRALAREQIREGAVKEWRTQNDAVAKLMVGIYDAAHQPLAQGDPPLTRQSADAAIEMYFFMASQVAGGDPFAPTPGMKDQWATGLAANYGKLNDAERKSVEQTPMTWAGIRAGWPELSAADREKFKAQWAQAPEVKQLVAALPNLRGGGGGPTATATGADGKPATAEEMMRRRQQDMENFKALNRMSTELFQARMAAASNMGGGWHYEYRYR